MWVFITLAVIVVAMIAVILCVTLPMCKEYDELFSREDDVAYDAQEEPKEDNGGDSALNIENFEIKE